MACEVVVGYVLAPITAVTHRAEQNVLCAENDYDLGLAVYIA